LSDFATMWIHDCLDWVISLLLGCRTDQIRRVLDLGRNFGSVKKKKLVKLCFHDCSDDLLLHDLVREQ
jgi:hypothetical protein